MSVTGHTTGWGGRGPAAPAATLLVVPGSWGQAPDVGRTGISCLAVRCRAALCARSVQREQGISGQAGRLYVPKERKVRLSTGPSHMALGHSIASGLKGATPASDDV